MNIPELKIKHGSMLDEERRRLYEEKQLGEYLDRKAVSAGVERLRELWASINVDGRVMRAITDITEVEYSEDIHAYVIGAGFTAMSKPFLVPLMTRDGRPYSAKDHTEILIHETIHNFIGDMELFPHLKQYWDFVREHYKAENKKVQNHLLVYAILEKVIVGIFSQGEVSTYINPVSPDYQRAWQLVQEKGADYFIEEFRELTTGRE